jgi:hypothetical protein
MRYADAMPLHRRARRGQSTVEWALGAAVLVLACVAAAYAFIPGFREEMSSAADSLSGLYTTGDLTRP